jgi:putative ABC transport system permease protein
MRTILVVLSIAVGVFAFASVFITNDVLVTNMDKQYKAINASTITLFTWADDDSPVRWAKRQNEVVDAQMRAVESVKIVTDKQTYNMDLYVYDDYNNLTVNRITPEQGVWPPAAKEIFLERTAIPLLNVPVGDFVTIELQDGTQYKLKLAGTVHDVNAIPTNLFPQPSGYITLQTLGDIGLPAVYNRLEIVTKSEYNTTAKLDKVAQALRDRLQQTGTPTSDLYSVREPGAHWARETVKSFTMILIIIGTFSLVMSGFLVVNTVSAMMMEQRRQIGIMKAIGGVGRQIISMYLVLVVCYGILALFVAVPVGLGLAYAFSMFAINFVNLNLVYFYLPTYVLLLVIAAALIVPLLAAAIPIFSSMRSPVREALSNYGIKEKGRHGRLDQLFLNVRRLPRPQLLSLRNTVRSKGRLLFTLSALTMAGMLFIGVINVRTSLMAELDNILKAEFNYQVQIYLNNNYPASGLKERAETVPGVIESQTMTYLQTQRIKPDGSEGSSFSITGISPNSDFLQPQMIAGRWLTEGDRNSIVLTSKLAQDMPDVQPGSSVILKVDNKQYTWEVVGIMQEAFDKAGYASFDYISSISGNSGEASVICIRTALTDPQSQEQVGKAVERRLKDAGVGVSYSMTKETLASSNAGQFDFLVNFMLVMAAMTAIIGALGLAGMMGLSVMERTREIGVIRSIGASNRAVAWVILTEGLLIGIISWLLALPLSIPFSYGFDNLIGNAFLEKPLIFTFSPLGPVIWLMIVIIISVIASLLPARRAARMSIRETLSYE